MILLLLLFATVPILQKEILAQQVIGNEIISNNNNENPNNVNESLPIPQIHVSIEGTEKPDKLRGEDQIDDGDGDDVIDGGIGDDELREVKELTDLSVIEEIKLLISTHQKMIKLLGFVNMKMKDQIIPDYFHNILLFHKSMMNFCIQGTQSKNSLT